jgi:hypothetical protein
MSRETKYFGSDGPITAMSRETKYFGSDGPITAMSRETKYRTKYKRSVTLKKSEHASLRIEAGVLCSSCVSEKVGVNPEGVNLNVTP